MSGIPPGEDESNAPSRVRITLYTREGCCLCETAKETLLRLCSEFGVQFEEVDIARDEALTRRYGECIPVVALNDRVMFRGRVNEKWLRLQLKMLRLRGALPST